MKKLKLEIEQRTCGWDTMVTHFTSDLWKLAQGGGLTMSENTTYSNWNNVSKALIAFAMQKYYEENNPNVTYGTELFTDLNTAGTGSNGIRFDMADVSTKFKTAFDNNQKLNLSDAKGFDLYFKNYIGFTGSFTTLEQQLINSMLPVLRDWYVQAGNGGMNAADTLNRGAFMLGGNGQDILTGGGKADLLVGNAGDDVLNGGAGSDVLIGAPQPYKDFLTGSDGNDHIMAGEQDDIVGGLFVGKGDDWIEGGNGNDTPGSGVDDYAGTRGGTAAPQDIKQIQFGSILGDMLCRDAANDARYEYGRRAA